MDLYRNLEVRESSVERPMSRRPTPEPSVPEPTLANAFSSLESLNKRLQEIRATTDQLAITIGGISSLEQDEKARGHGQSAGSSMQYLNFSINDAHFTVSEIERALTAIRGALGV